MEDVIRILLKLSLMNAEASWDIAGAVFLVFQIPVEGTLPTKLAVTGQSYHDATKGKKSEERKMGPPVLHSWTI